jgi:hypothetical protein
MKYFFIAGAIAFAPFAVAESVSECNAALVTTTIVTSHKQYSDYRLAILTTEERWNQRKQSASAEIPIDGIPLGGSWSEFSRERTARLSSLDETLTEAEATSLVYEKLEDPAAGAYMHCISILKASLPGKFVVSSGEDKDPGVASYELQLVATVDPVPRRLNLTWTTPSGNLPPNLPDTIDMSDTPSMLLINRLPNMTQSLAVNATARTGWWIFGRDVDRGGANLTVTGIFPPPPTPPVKQFEYGGDYDKAANASVLIAAKPFRQRVTVVCNAKFGNYRPGNPYHQMVFRRDGVVLYHSGEVGYTGPSGQDGYYVVTIPDPFLSFELDAGKETTLRIETDNKNLDLKNLFFQAKAVEIR